MGTLHAANTSVWVATTPDEPLYAPLSDKDEPSPVDVVVVGAGITGLSAALSLAERGASVAVLEAGQICSGATGYTTAKVTSQHGLIYAGLLENRGEDVALAYANANEAAIAHIAHWIDKHSIECEFERRDAVTYTLDPARIGAVEAEVDAASKLGLPATFTTECAELPYDVQAAVTFSGQAQFHPRRYCIGLAEAVVRHGGRIHERTRVTGVSWGAPAEITTEHGRIRAGHVVIATHLPFLDRGGFFARAHPSRSYCVAFRLPERQRPPLAMYLSADQPTRSLRTASADNLLIVGGEGHKTGRDADTRQRYAALESWAAANFQLDSVAHRWSAQDFTPVDGTPFVGPLLPGSRVLVATGFNKWGMTNGTAAGRMLADLATGESPQWSSAFDTNRLWPTLTSRSTYLENIETVGGHLVADRLRTLRPPDAASLAPGEGGIVELNGRKAAAYRHSDGRLEAVSPVCRHQGCLVAFNTAEKTWDCPCHGSRYALDGRVIEGPSVHDLAPVQEADES